MASIEKGVVTRTTKARLEELEAEEDELLTSLQLEQAKAPKITKGMILFLLDKFRQMDMRVMKNREKLIDSLVKAIILYYDRILIYLTYTDETVTIPTSEEVSDVENSLDVTSSGVPTINKRDTQPGIPLIYFRYAKGLERFKSQYAGGTLLPPVQKLVASFIFARLPQGQKCKRVPFDVRCPPDG